LEQQEKEGSPHDKYNQLVEADEQEVEHEYSSAYRGRVQNRKVGDEFMPMYVLSYRKNDADVSSYTAFDSEVEHFNQTAAPRHRINITCNPKTLSEGETKAYFSLIDTLSVAIDAIKNLNREKGLLVQRAIAYAVTQNFDAAINDLTAYVQQDSTLAMAYWQRAVCQSLINEFAQSQGIESKLKSLGTLDDFAKAAQLNPHNPYIYNISVIINFIFPSSSSYKNKQSYISPIPLSTTTSSPLYFIILYSLSTLTLVLNTEPKMYLLSRLHSKLTQQKKLFFPINSPSFKE